MVSIKDIAQHCGVSVATVSKALNNAPDIAEETRQRIRQAASELGYMTNAAARALKTNRSYNLGVLFYDEGSRGLTHEFFAALLNSFKAEAERQGYDITFINNHHIGGMSATYLQHCKYRGIDGLLLACIDFYDPQVVEVVNSSLPVVTIDHVFNNRSSILSDNIAGMETLVRYAFDLGHRDLVLIQGDPTAVTENRKKGFFRACEELGIPASEKKILQARYYDPESCYNRVKELLSSEKRPDCIIFPDDFSLVGGIRAIREMGLHVPDDISVMGYDGIVISQVMTPSITTIRQDTEKMGQAAARKLIELIDHPRTALEEVIVIPGMLLPGESVKQISQR